MNGKILQKCIDKLKSKKDDADIQYVLGMLETLLEMQPESEKKICTPTMVPPITTPAPTIKDTEVKKTEEMDEGKILEANMLANLGKVEKSAIATEQP